LSIFVVAALVIVLMNESLYALDRDILQDGQTLNGSQDRSFFGQFIISGGPIVWFVLMPLSVVACYLAIDISMTLQRKRVLPFNCYSDILNILQRNSIAGAKDSLVKRNDMLSYAISRAISYVSTTKSYMHLQNITAESLEEKTLELMRKVEWLNIVGNVSPMIGLFGTVYGMIKTFNTIVIAGGQPQADQLAGGISIALVTTFWGLLIAIPSLAIYGFFRNRVETLASEAAIEAETLLQHLQNKKESDAS
jgi:biopolymer transport protein ExbB